MVFLGKFFGSTKRMAAVATTFGSLAFAAPAQADLSLVFSPDSIGPGGQSTATFTLDNTTVGPLSELAFSLNLGANVTVAGAPAIDSTCNGTLTATGGASTISFADGGLGIGENCTISLQVLGGATNGTNTLTTSQLSSDAGDQGDATDDLTITDGKPSFSKTLAPTSVALNGTTTMTYTVNNAANGSLITSISFSENLPSGLVFATPTNLTTDCSSLTPTATAGGSTLTAFNGFVLAGAACTLSIDVQAQSVGDFTLTSGDMTYSTGGPPQSAGKASAELTVTAPPSGAPSLTQVFSGDPAAGGETVTLSFTLTNTDPTNPATLITFTEDFDTPLTGTTLLADVTDPCGSGSSITGAGTGTMTFAGGSLAARSQCNFDVTVQLPASPTGGDYLFTSSTVQAEVNGDTVFSASPASDTLTVSDNPKPTVSLSITDVADLAVSGATTATVTLTNTAAVDATGVGFDLQLSPPLSDLISLGTLDAGTCPVGGVAQTNTNPRTLSLINATITASSSCTFDIPITLPADHPAGDFTLTIDELTGTIGGGSFVGAGASDTFSVNAGIADVSMRKSFDSFGIPGGTVGVTYELSNGSLLPVTDIGFTDAITAAVAGSTGFAVDTNTCNGTATGGSTLTVSGASMAASGSCEITGTLTLGAGVAGGDYLSTTSDITATLDGFSAATIGNSAASATLEVQEISLDFAFDDDSVLPGQNSTVSITLTNNGSLAAPITNITVGLSPINFSAAFVSTLSNTCGSADAPVTGFIAYTGGSVPAGSSCSIQAEFSVPNSATQQDARVTAAANVGTVLSEDDVIRVGGPLADGGTLSLTKAFVDASVEEGANTDVTFTITNESADLAVNTIGFSDDLDAFRSGTTLVSTVSDSCSATGSGAGASIINFSNINLAAGASCAITVRLAMGVTGDLGDFTNTTSTISGDVSSVTVTGTAASDSILVQSNVAPTFTKTFPSGTINQNGQTTVQYTISMPVALGSFNQLTFDDVLGSAISGATLVSVPSNGSCGAGSQFGGTGTDTMTMRFGALSGGESCTFTATIGITTAPEGSVTSTSGDLFNATTALVSGASASLTVNSPPPDLALAFAANPVDQGVVSTMTFTIDASAVTTALSGVGFTNTLPSGLVISTPANAVSSCGGTLTAVAGTSSVSLTGGSLAANASCTISLDVVAQAAGAYANTTSALSTNLGDGGAASATLTVNAAPPPGFAQVFSPDSMLEGATTTLTFTIDNSGAFVEANTLSFTNNLPAGLVIASTPNVANTCNGTATAVAASSVVSLTGGTVAPSASCTVSVDVTTVDDGSYVNVSGALTSNLGNSGTSTDTLTVNAPPVPPLAKTYTPSTVTQGEVTTVSISIDNSAALLPVTAVNVTDTFAASMTVATVANTSVGANCVGGTLTAVPGATSVTYTGGSVTAGQTCTISYDVVALNTGSLANTLSMTSSLGPNTAPATLTVNPAPAPTITHAFAPSSIEQDGFSTLTVTIDNSAAFIAAGSLGLQGDLSAAVLIANDGAARVPTNSCGGTLLAPNNSNRMQLSGGNIPAQGSCVLTVDVTSSTIGNYTNTLSGSTSTLGASTLPAPAALEVVARTTAEVTFEVATDTDGDFGFASSEAAFTFTLTTSSGEGTEGPISVDAGSYSVTVSPPSGTGITAMSCNDSDSTATLEGGTFSLVLAAREQVTCTVTSRETLQRTVDTIHNFLHRRSTLILANPPSRSRRLDRMNSAGVGGQTLSFAQGDILSMLPVDFDPMAVSSGSFSLSGSLQQAREARAMALLAHDPYKTNMFVENSKWDLWFEGSYSKFEGSSDSEGHFGIAYIGLDYVVSRDLLIGALVQFDQMEDSSEINGSSVEGRGWMVGPYVTARLRDNLIFDGRFALGKSTNDISPFGTYTDTFETSRVLIEASLSGQYLVQGWTVSPNVSLAYLHEKQKSYVDSLNVTIPAQTVSLGQLRFGPNVSRRFTQPDGSSFEPFVSLDGIYTFGSSDDIVSAEATKEAEGLRARVEAGFTTTNEYGTQLSVRANYDGIGLSDFESYGVSVKLNIPLQ